MKNNIGIVKAFLFDQIKENYLKTGDINESRTPLKDFFSLIKESELLRLELNTYKKLEKKFIDNDILATRYIDETISKFNSFTKDQYINENSKLDRYLIKGNIDSERANLYEAIGTLIYQTISDEVDVDDIHESFTVVLNHVKTEKKEMINESILNDMLSNHFNMDDVINIAVKKFNEKYSHLDEGEKEILTTLTFGSDDDKKSLFESLKEENLTLLEGAEKNGIEDRINITIQKINDMKYDKETLIENVTSLHELKNGLS